MAITQVVSASPSNEVVFTDTAMGNTADGIHSSSTVAYSVAVDNSNNGGAASYVKLYNLASGSITVGTTIPDEVIYVPAGAIVTLNFGTGVVPGKTFGTALAAACVTTGGTAGTIAPASTVAVSVVYSSTSGGPVG